MNERSTQVFLLAMCGRKREGRNILFGYFSREPLTRFLKAEVTGHANFLHGGCHPFQSKPSSMIRLFQTWRCLASEVSRGYREHGGFLGIGGEGEGLTAWVCSSSPAVSSKSGRCYVSQCVWRNQPGPKQNSPMSHVGNIKLSGSRGFAGGLWD